VSSIIRQLSVGVRSIELDVYEVDGVIVVQ